MTHPGTWCCCDESCSACEPLVTVPPELPSVGTPEGYPDDVFPCWYNGIDRVHSINFTHRLLITRESDSHVMLDWQLFGRGNNLQVHPDACGSCNPPPSAEDCDHFDPAYSGTCCDDCTPYPRMPNGPWPWSCVAATATAYGAEDGDKDTQACGDFGWLRVDRRYTTPMWTVGDRTLYPFVLVPYPLPVDLACSSSLICTISDNSRGVWGVGFGVSGASEIATIEAIPGFAWDTIDPGDGLWMAKTDRGDVRLMFVKPPLTEGEVFRTFRDWDLMIEVSRGGYTYRVESKLEETDCSSDGTYCEGCRVSFPEREAAQLTLTVDLPCGSITNAGTGNPGGVCYAIGSLRLKNDAGADGICTMTASADSSSDLGCCGELPFPPNDPCGVGANRYRNFYACAFEDPANPGNLHPVHLKMDYATTAGVSAACAAAVTGGCDPYAAGCYENQTAEADYDGALFNSTYIDCDYIHFEAAAEQVLNPIPTNHSCSFLCTDAANLLHDEFQVRWREAKYAGRSGGDPCTPVGVYEYPDIYWRTSGIGATWEQIPLDYAAVVTVAPA